MATQLPDLPPVARLSPRVIRILGGNPSKYTLQGTNTYLIGTGRERLLIDTGHGLPAWKESVKKVLDDEKAEVSKVILTHWHPDHVGGVTDLKALQPHVEVLKHRPGEGWDGKATGFDDGAEISVEGATLKATYTPGHAIDHMVFRLAEEDALFTGDNVLGHGTAVFEDLAAYMASLKTMSTLFNGRAYPGHGEVITEGKPKVLEYIEHRRQREIEALEILGRKREDGKQDWASMELVKVIYAQYPEHLHQPAEGSLLHVLRKLEGEGRVRKAGSRWELIDGGRL
ncbi:hypothetical protein B0A48_12670 [Cryoendolithus antarcticus]|uniref:Metallo-beta-lactamase domain-containing protein n=1 Tax=Cryoendolithus antarcticus TaxID=1507870 RepID=A0A1V8SRI5_9PEZI|nr:hypothetical protein B0A48_12670 [Cryoendolithus antarcticus]